MQREIAVHVNEIGGRTVAGQNFIQGCLFLDEFIRRRQDINPLLNFLDLKRDAPGDGLGYQQSHCGPNDVIKTASHKMLSPH